jgi:hypothetical protein
MPPGQGVCVAIVAISRRVARPTRYARAASRWRSSSVRRSRCPASRQRRGRFSSIKVCDGLPLPAVQPAGQHQHHLQPGGVDREPQLISWAGANEVGRCVEEYGRVDCATLTLLRVRSIVGMNGNEIVAGEVSDDISASHHTSWGSSRNHVCIIKPGDRTTFRECHRANYSSA